MAYNTKDEKKKQKKKQKKGEIKDIGKKDFDYGKYVQTNVKKGLNLLGFKKGGKIEKYGAGGGTGSPGQGGGGGSAPGGSSGSSSSRKTYNLDYKKKKKVQKKRYGGSVSYNSGSVKGYSKTYSGMGGEDE
tara:strand:+ start:1021 stop:1413 length:393 start_codon:yes stop_codon:yes gene_type:complete